MIIINRLWLWAYFLLGGMFFLIVYLIIAEIKNGRKRFGMVDGIKLAKRLKEAGQGKVKTGQSQALAQGQSSQKKNDRVINIIHELVCIQAILYSPNDHTILKLATTINRINGLIRKLLDSNCIDCPVKDCYIEELAKTAKGGTE